MLPIPPELEAQFEEHLAKSPLDYWEGVEGEKNPGKISALLKSLADLLLFLRGEAVPLTQPVADLVPIFRGQGLPLLVTIFVALLILGREFPVPFHSSSHLLPLFRGQGLPPSFLFPQAGFIVRRQSLIPFPVLLGGVIHLRGPLLPAAHINARRGTLAPIDPNGVGRIGGL
jgi:hypothetical protein